MNLRKTLNLPNRIQRRELERQKSAIWHNCETIARKEYDEQIENKKVHDGMCPKCNNKMGIVEKFTFVQGRGSIEGRIIFGFGKIKGDTTIDTTVVNYCMECTHEWLKYKTKPISKTDILKVAFKYLNDIIQHPGEKKPYWKEETIQVFDGCCAEALYQLDTWTVKKNRATYRRFYRSIFDAPQDVKLEKL